MGCVRTIFSRANAARDRSVTQNRCVNEATHREGDCEAGSTNDGCGRIFSEKSDFAAMPPLGRNCSTGKELLSEKRRRQRCHPYGGATAAERTKHFESQPRR